MDRIYAVAMVSCLVAACDQAPTELENSAGPAAPSLQMVAQHQSFTDPFAFTIFNECTGEDMAIEGEGKIQINDVSPVDDAPLHTELHAVFTGTGVGLSSGIRYAYKDLIHESFNSPNPPAPHGTLTSPVETWHLRCQGGAPDLQLHVVFKIVFLPPDARLVVTVDHTRFACRG
jgi:hypothetical protein